jgi:hypothetical protein
MFSIPAHVRRRLVAALQRMALVAGVMGRNALLAGIPSANFSRNNDNAGGDLDLLIVQTEDNFAADGEWRLRVLVDNAIHKAAGTAVGNELLEICAELDAALAEHRKKRLNPADVAQPHLFDLRIPVAQCVNALLPEAAEMRGFMLPTSTARLLHPFCKSLRDRAIRDSRWTRGRVHVRAPLEIRLPQTSVDAAIECAKRQKPRLDEDAIVWSVYARETDDAKSLWLRLKDEFGCKLNNDFVVVFGMPAGTHYPDDLLPLTLQKFTAKHVLEWIMPIIKSSGWQDPTLSEYWMQVFVADHVDSQDELPIEWLYDQLESHQELVQDNPTENAFKKALGRPQKAPIKQQPIRG